MSKQYGFSGKIIIKAHLKVLTGMHIGTNKDYAPIGSVDAPIIRDLATQTPIIPGSSLKGKLRTILAKLSCDNYILHSISKDSEVIKRLFGSSDPIKTARLQFFDLFINEESKNYFEKLDCDTYLGEIKFENTIARTTGQANPRQIERVPAGMIFNLQLVYNVESNDISEIQEDIKELGKGLHYLELDYLGGHGTRGYGRVKIENYTVEILGNTIISSQEVTKILTGE